MTLSVMDELGFTTGYDCMKCTKLDADFKTAKTENEDLRKLVAALKTQASKTATLLQKFNSNKNMIQSQRQTIQRLEKQNQLLESDSKTISEQLRQHLITKPSTMTENEQESLKTELQSQKLLIDQQRVRLEDMERQFKSLKSERDLLDRKCKRLESKKNPDDNEKLKAEIAKAKQEIYRLKAQKDSTINNLAEKKNKDILKTLGDMSDHNLKMELKMKEILETVKTVTINSNNTPSMSPGNSSGMSSKHLAQSEKQVDVKTCREKRIGRPPGSKSKKSKQGQDRNNDSDSDLLKPEKQIDVETPRKKRIGRPPGSKSKKSKHSKDESDDSDFDLSIPSKITKRKALQRKSSNRETEKITKKPMLLDVSSSKLKGLTKTSLSNSESSDSDMVEALEDTFKVSPFSEPTKVLPPSDDAVLVCDVLREAPKTSHPLSTIRSCAPTIPPKTTMRLDVEMMFDLMESSPILSPPRQAAVPPIKSEVGCSSGNLPESHDKSDTIDDAPIITTSLLPCKDDPEPMVVKSDLIEQDATICPTASIVHAENRTSQASEENFQCTKMEGDVLPVPKQDLIDTETGDSEETVACTKAAKTDLPVLPQTLESIDALQLSNSTEPPSFLPILIKNEKIKIKKESSAKVLTIGPISRANKGPKPTPFLAKMDLILSSPAKSVVPLPRSEPEVIPTKNTIPLPEQQPQSEINDLCLKDEVKPPAVEANVACTSSSVLNDVCFHSPKKEDTSKPQVPAANTEETSKLDIHGSSVQSISQSPVEKVSSEPLSAPESSAIDELKPQGTVDSPILLDLDKSPCKLDEIGAASCISESSIQCAFEMDISVASQSSQSEGTSDIGSDNEKRSKRVARMNKKLHIDASFDILRSSGTPSESEDASLPKKDRRSTSNERSNNTITKTLRSRNISVSDESINKTKSFVQQSEEEDLVSPSVKVLRKRGVALTEKTKTTVRSKKCKTLKKPNTSTPPELKSNVLENHSPNENNSIVSSDKEDERPKEEISASLDGVHTDNTVLDTGNSHSKDIIVDVDTDAMEKIEVPKLDLPPAQMFASFMVQDTTLSPIFDSTSAKRPGKRKKSTPPAVEQIFNLFIPESTVPSLVSSIKTNHVPTTVTCPTLPTPTPIANLEADLEIDTSDNDEQPSKIDQSADPSVPPETPPPSIVSVDLRLLNCLRNTAPPPACPVDEEPLFYSTHEDFKHLVNQPKKILKCFNELFRKNLCTSSPNIPYIMQTIIINHKQKALQNLEDKLIAVIKNEIKVRNTQPPGSIIPPVDVLVEFFFDLLTKLEKSDYHYFIEMKCKKRLLKLLFVAIGCISKNYNDQYKTLLSFAVKLSMMCEDLSYLRLYVINNFISSKQRILQSHLMQCLNQYSANLLLGHSHIGFKKDSSGLRDIPCLYLAGLEFYLRYTAICNYHPNPELPYVHQFAVEHHLIKSALEAITVKDEYEEKTGPNEQGALCLQLMVRSQGWSWLLCTLLPIMFDKLSTTTEYGTCRILELIETLVTSEILMQRADLTLVKDKYIPTLTGLLWTAPSFEVKNVLANCLVLLAPISYQDISSQLSAWIVSLPVKLQCHELYKQLRLKIGQLSKFVADKY